MQNFAIWGGGGRPVGADETFRNAAPLSEVGASNQKARAGEHRLNRSCRILYCSKPFWTMNFWPCRCLLYGVPFTLSQNLLDHTSWTELCTKLKCSVFPTTDLDMKLASISLRRAPCRFSILYRLLLGSMWSSSSLLKVDPITGV